MKYIALIITVTALAVRADEPVDYLQHIRPLLHEKCASCHGALKQEGGLRLDASGLIASGGDSGPALVPGNPAKSLLLERVMADEDSRMPPAEDGAALKPQEVELLRRWISLGANAPAERIPEPPSKHWAFQTVESPLSADDQQQVHAGMNPIDLLLNRRMAASGLTPVPAAERSLQIRRLYLDLIGLPPTPKQLADERPWGEIVDELLASPQHGERWGRHWMDVWRYTDWYGLGAQLRNSQKHIWHWRDWIVSSLNKDKGYDRMIQEMLAGDELDPANPDAIAGTGFLARNYYLFNRTTWLDSTIEHTGKAFLGLTLNCAKCHDHKYDPLTHEDYYSFRAIFEPHQVRLDPVPGQSDLEKDGLPRVFDDHLDAVTKLHLRGNPKTLDEETQINARVPELFVSFQPEIKSVSLPVEAWAPSSRDYVREDQRDAARLRIVNARQAYMDAKEKLAAAPKEKLKESGLPQFAFEDDFSAPRPADWDLVGPWKYENGTVLRTTSTREAEHLRLKHQLPRDFELTCEYTHTGGAEYRSVTFRFDQSDDRKFENFVYTSAHAPGPKVHVAYTRGGQNAYPNEGRAAFPVKIGQKYELRFAVKKTLVNVWIDGKFQVAYSLPDRNPEGALSLSGFDATVAFDRIAIRTLPSDFKMEPSKNAVAASAGDLKVKVEAAEADMRAAALKQLALKAVFAADDARFAGNEDQQLNVAAAKAQAEALIADGEYDQLAGAGDQKRITAGKAKVAKGKTQLAAAEQGKYVSQKVTRKALEGPDHTHAKYPAVFEPTSTGRRLSLARWMTDRRNPLTARVAVNHVWLRHFGQPLVESVDDFGLRAKEPLHADVLDFLAVEFMESGWSFRHLHRLIVTSDAFRRSSSTVHADPQTSMSDSENRYLWRMHTRRMEAQVVRDSILQLAGRLDLTMGGPSLNISDAVVRRSLYFKHSRDQQNLFLAMFDDADHLQCYRRSESVVPQQALALANSKLSLGNAAPIAARIGRSSLMADDDFAAAAFEWILGRSASQQEIAACVNYCARLQEIGPEHESEAKRQARVRTRLVHGLLNHNDFVTIR